MCTAANGHLPACLFTCLCNVLILANPGLLGFTRLASGILVVKDEIPD